MAFFHPRPVTSRLPSSYMSQLMFEPRADSASFNPLQYILAPFIKTIVNGLFGSHESIFLYLCFGTTADQGIHFLSSSHVDVLNCSKSGANTAPDFPSFIFLSPF